MSSLLDISHVSKTFTMGGLTGVMVAVASFDLQAHDTFTRRRPVQTAP